MQISITKRTGKNLLKNAEKMEGWFLFHTAYHIFIPLVITYTHMVALDVDQNYNWKRLRWCSLCLFSLQKK